jgi:hypothetical protein
MLTANVTIDGNKQQINIIDLHARANTSGDAQGTTCVNLMLRY